MGLTGTFKLGDFLKYQQYVWFLGVGAPLTICWFISSLAETNRKPFDLAEGESELVSGFNVEYRSGGFALIFLAEHCSILFMRMFFRTMCLGGFRVRIPGSPLYCGGFHLWKNFFRGYGVPRVARDCWYHLLGGVLDSGWAGPF